MFLVEHSGCASVAKTWIYRRLSNAKLFTFRGRPWMNSGARQLVRFIRTSSVSQEERLRYSLVQSRRIVVNCNVMSNVAQGKRSTEGAIWKEKPKVAHSSNLSDAKPLNTTSHSGTLISSVQCAEQSNGSDSHSSQADVGNKLHTVKNTPKSFPTKAPASQTAQWGLKGFATSTQNAVETEDKSLKIDMGEPSSSDKTNATSGTIESTTTAMKQQLSTLFEELSMKGPLGGDFVVDKKAFTHSQIRATFYPKFENEKSDQEIRMKMIELVSSGKANLEVTLKHSGSLFMYAGHEGGAYAKNSYGNVYTAVGVFVLGRMLQQAWGIEAEKKQKDFNDYLQKKRMSISMELVTAVLGDHGQRPLQDYAVVTAVTELTGKPRFYSTPEIISFCRKWRLPTNSVWLFSTRKSVSAFFAAYDALCEEGTATPVCRTLDEIANISVPGTKDHIKFQGEILEGLVARIVSSESGSHLQRVLEEVPPPPDPAETLDFGPNLRQICAANNSSEQQQIKALLRSTGTAMCRDYTDWFPQDVIPLVGKADRTLATKFLQCSPSDYATKKLQEMIKLMKQRRYQVDLKCRFNYRKFPYVSSNSVQFKLVVHVYQDSVFRRYQREMRGHPGLWPLYRGFFVDVHLFKVPEDKEQVVSKDCSLIIDQMESSFGAKMFQQDDLADELENLMIKLKFLTYKLRTFLIRNGLATLFRGGPAAYREYYMRQLEIWGTSAAKKKEMSNMLEEWAVYIRRKWGKRMPPSSSYLSDAEPFLEQYAHRSPQNQRLIGAAGSFVKTEGFMVAGEAGFAEEGEFITNKGQETLDTSPNVAKASTSKGIIVFFPGIPGCAKSALCREIVKAPGGLGDDRPINNLMGDLIKGRYWQKILDERRKKPCEIILADKNAPNEEVWRQIEDMGRSTNAIAVPVVPSSEGTETNPFSLDALAVFMFRVLQRVNHPGSLDKDSPNAGYVLLMFYNLYEGKNRKDFEAELRDRFGLLIKTPLLKPDRKSLPDSVKGVLEEGLHLYQLHAKKHGRLESTKGAYAKEWATWEKRLRETLFAHADYLNEIQVPFEHVVKDVLDDLRAIVKGDVQVQSSEKRKLGTIVFAAVSLPVSDVMVLLDEITAFDSRVGPFLEKNNVKASLNRAHVTLAHKRSHGVTSVASYGAYSGQEVPVEFKALYFSDKLAALEVEIGNIGEEKVESKNSWPHVTIWTGQGSTPKEANTLPELLSEGKATKVDFKEPLRLSGRVEFF